MNVIFVFQGDNANFASAVFSNKENAVKWIRDYQLSGILTQYPIDNPIYDWAIDNGYFSPNKDIHKMPEFIEKFSSAYLEHWHFKNGNIIT